MRDVMAWVKRFSMGIAAGTLMVVAVAAQTGGGPAASSAPAARDLTGFWELTYLDSQHVPRASLSPRVTKAVVDAQARRDFKAIRWCNILGMPAIMASPRPLDIRQTDRIVVIAAEINAATRNVYLDRTTHINRDEFDPTTNGDSIGRWEGDTLIVDTVGFDPNKGVTAIPGGGFRTADSHLTERYRLLNNGAVLSVTFRWEDSKVFRTPHTYEFRYVRMPKDYEARLPLACDPFDEGRTKFLSEGPQAGDGGAPARRP
jgi:hypothetical protein